MLGGLAELMADLPDGAKFALCVAVGVAHVIQQLLEFVRAMDPPSPLLDAAVAAVAAALPFVFLTAMVLLQMAPPANPPPPPGAARRFACLACVVVAALLVVLTMPVVLLMVLYGGPPPPGWGRWDGRPEHPPPT